MSMFSAKTSAPLLVIFAILSIWPQTVRAETELTGPATLNKAGESYRLAGDITASGTAFTISADNVTLDLGGHTVVYNTGSETSYGVWVTGNRATVKNGVIIQGSGGSSMSPNIYISGGSEHDIHHLVLKVSGWKTSNVWATRFNNSQIHHNYLEHHGTTDAQNGDGLDGMLIEASGGGVQIYDNIIVSSHYPVNCRYFGNNPSNIYNNLIQPERVGGVKNPYGIALIKSRLVHVYNNQIVSDSARGIILDGWAQGALIGSDHNVIENNRIDVQYSSAANGGWYSENNVYGIRDRYSSGYNTFQNNTVMVDSDLGGRVWGFYIGSDGTDPAMVGIVARDNTVITRKSDGGSTSNTKGFSYEVAEEVDVINNDYYTDGVFSEVIGWAKGVTDLTVTGNTAITPRNFTPQTPTGLSVTKFLDSYLLRWNDNNEDQVYEYIVYRDGQKLSATPRGGTFYVDVDVGGSHTYAISALNLAGAEGAKSAAVSTAEAANAWWGGTSPTPDEPPASEEPPPDDLHAMISVGDVETGFYESTDKGRDKITTFVPTDAFNAGEKLEIRLYLLDIGAKTPVANAVVDIGITGPESTHLTTEPSDNYGVAEADWRTSTPNKKGLGGTIPGTYTATVTDVIADGYTWDGVMMSIIFSIQ